jgi:hypothetical protein
MDTVDWAIARLSSPIPQGSYGIVAQQISMLENPLRLSGQRDVPLSLCG